jgi:hypothetical protein
LIGVRIGFDALKSLIESLPIKWVSAHGAIDLLLPLYGSGAGMAAGMALAKRAHSGLLKTRARLFKWEALQLDDYNREKKVVKENSFRTLSAQFWWAEGHEALTQNWVSGDFSTWIDSRFHWQAFGVEFGRRAVEAMLPPKTAPLVEARPVDPNSTFESAATSAPRGRRPAKWWADFAEELAVYLHENGIPAGIDTEGQSEVIEAVNTRLASSGKNEADRTTVQPVVNAVLIRIRSADK